MQPVEPNLDLVISELEKEQRSLKKMIKGAATEHDNLIVYYHSEALLEINNRLNILYSFRDPDFEKKETIKRQIILLKRGDHLKKLKPFLQERIMRRNKDRANELKQQLQQLLQGPQPVARPDTHIIDDALLALFERRWRSFHLLLGEDKDGKLLLVFKTKRNLLTVQLQLTINDEPDFVLHNRVPRPLEAAGFVYNLQRKRFERAFNFSQAGKIQEIKIWLAKFIIDDTHQYWPGRKIRLRYKA